MKSSNHMKNKYSNEVPKSHEKITIQMKPSNHMKKLPFKLSPQIT